MKLFINKTPNGTLIHEGVDKPGGKWPDVTKLYRNKIKILLKTMDVLNAPFTRSAP